MRSGGTYATAKGLNLCPRDGLPAYRDRYDVVYPLREYKFDRKTCGQVIVDAGLPLPPKSACFFCPAMHKIEIVRLAATDPDMYLLAVAMEEIYRGGKHFRGDTFWTVRARHKETGEKYEFGCHADSSAAARAAFRKAYDDTRKPFKYRLDTSAAVPGLGRRFAWGTVDAPLGPSRGVIRTSNR